MQKRQCPPLNLCVKTEMDYKIIRSDRKTLEIRVSKDCEVIVRAPKRLSEKLIKAEVEKAKDWIEKAITRQRQKKFSAMNAEFAPEKVMEMKKKAIKIITPITEKYAKLMNVTPSGIKITSARTRYGSCSGKNSLCFSYLLMQYPIEAIEAVVVHELAHIKHKNHGKGFYSFIYSVMPDYEKRKKLLKQ